MSDFRLPYHSRLLRRVVTLRQRVGWIDRIANAVAPLYTQETGNDAMNYAARPVRVGGWLALIIFGVFGLWALFAPLDSAAVAPGIVVVDSNSKSIQHLEGGIIDEILVHEGMHVNEGDPLVRLSETAAGARLDLLRGQYYLALATEARLVAERDGLEKITFPEEVLAEKNRELSKDILDSQKRLFDARQNAIEGQVDVLNQRVAQLREEIEGLTAQEQAANRQISLLNEEIDVVSKLLAKGNANKPRLLSLKRAASELQGKRGEYLAMIARAKQSITEAELEIINVRNDFLNKVVAELRDTQASIADLKERIRASADILDRVVITSPQSGIVNGLNFHTKGGVIGPGEVIMNIVPDEDKLTIEAQVSPQDIDVVRPGLPARVRLTAYKMRNIPPLEGEVVRISADRFEDERTGRAYYIARIEIDQSSLKDHYNISLYPGMPADVLIVTGEQTLFQYLAAPITDSFFRAFREQ